MAIDDEHGLSYMVDEDYNGYVFRNNRKDYIAIYPGCKTIDDVRERYVKNRCVHHYYQQPLRCEREKGIFGRRKDSHELVDELNHMFKRF
jgi:hypothetical protein